MSAVGRLLRWLAMSKRTRRTFEPLRSQLAGIRIMAMVNPRMHGSHHAKTGDGLAFGQRGFWCPWFAERLIVAGQWAGPWKRVKDISDV